MANGKTGKACMENYDVIVIGCGINGAGVAQAAAAAGYSVLVIEQNNEIARETSSRSSKLIHGGLRYLESADFQLVRECLRERRLLLKNAPGLVRLVPFYIPVYKQTTRSTLKITAGLCLYSMMSRTRFRKLSTCEWNTIDNLNTQDLTSVFVYFDAHTNDALLTSTVMRSAHTLGAKLRTGSKFIDAHVNDDHVDIRYQHNDRTITCTCLTLVNASGPWVNRVHTNISPVVSPLDMEMVGGSHILLPGSLLHGMYYLESLADRRAIFAMPWHGKTLIGTTETKHTGDPGCPKALESEKQYLLDVYNHYFSKDRTLDDIIESFAGLRVLPDNRKNPFCRTRDVRLLTGDDHKTRYVAVYGGKLTSYRSTAERVMHKLRTTLPARSKRINTKDVHLIRE